jgi:hypothetical protein
MIGRKSQSWTVFTTLHFGLYRENLTLKEVRIFAPQDFSPFLEKNYPNPPG